MACILVGAKPSSEPMLEFYHYEPQEQISAKSKAQFIQENSVENVVYKMATILFWPGCINA